MSDGYYTRHAADKMLYKFSVTKLSLHTDYPGDAGTHEYDGDHYERQDASFGLPEDEFGDPVDPSPTRWLEDHVEFLGVPTDAVEWLGLWQGSTFRGALPMPGNTMFTDRGDGVGVLVMLAEATTYGIGDCDGDTAYLTEATRNAMVEYLADEQTYIEGEQEGFWPMLSLHTADPGEDGDNEYDGFGSFGVYQRWYPEFMEADLGKVRLAKNILFSGDPTDTAAPYLGLWRQRLVGYTTSPPAPIYEWDFHGAVPLGAAILDSGEPDPDIAAGEFEDDVGVLVVLRYTSFGLDACEEVEP